MSPIALTYKSRDVEETLDVYFYRPCGYGLAVASRSLGLTPNGVTLIGSIIGIIAGHLFFYTNPAVNAAGVVLLLLSEMLDSADGQLARMTQRYSKLGRILDGIGDNMKFISVYIHIIFRVALATGWWWIAVVAVLAGMSHSLQSAMADFYKTAYIFFVENPEHHDRETSGAIAERYAALTWRNDFWTKLTTRVYLNYAREQEMLAGSFQSVELRAVELFGSRFPEWFSSLYRSLNRPMLKYYNILTTNTRMIVLILAIAAGIPWLYFAFEIVVLNALLAYVVRRQESISRRLADALAETREDKP